MRRSRVRGMHVWWALHLLRSTASSRTRQSLIVRMRRSRGGQEEAHIDAGGLCVALHLQHGLHLEEVGLAGGRQDPGHRAHQQQHLEAPPLVALRLRMPDRGGRISGTCTKQQISGKCRSDSYALAYAQVKDAEQLISHHGGFKCGPCTSLSRM